MNRLLRVAMILDMTLKLITFNYSLFYISYECQFDFNPNRFSVREVKFDGLVTTSAFCITLSFLEVIKALHFDLKSVRRDVICGLKSRTMRSYSLRNIFTFFNTYMFRNWHDKIYVSKILKHIFLISSSSRTGKKETISSLL